MALAATRITLKYAPLPELERVTFTEDVEDSMRINEVRAGAVIISASGMCEGGRVRHHRASRRKGRASSSRLYNR